MGPFELVKLVLPRAFERGFSGRDSGAAGWLSGTTYP
jgi:hypothetical protein